MRLYIAGVAWLIRITRSGIGIIVIVLIIIIIIVIIMIIAERFPLDIILEIVDEWLDRLFVVIKDENIICLDNTFDILYQLKNNISYNNTWNASKGNESESLRGSIWWYPYPYGWYNCGY